MLGVNPYIAYKGNCRQAIEFYQEALGAEVLFTQTVGESPMSNMGPAENIMHCSLKVGGSTLMMCDDPRPGPASTDGNISLAIGLNDPAKAKQYFDNLWKPRTGRNCGDASRKDFLGRGLRHGDRPVRHQVDGQLRRAQMTASLAPSRGPLSDFHAGLPHSDPRRVGGSLRHTAAFLAN